MVLRAVNRPRVPVILPVEIKFVLMEETTANEAVIILVEIFVVFIVLAIKVLIVSIPVETKFVFNVLIKAVVPTVNAEATPVTPAAVPTISVDVYIDPFTSNEY